MGPEPSLQFGAPCAGCDVCQFGSFVRSVNSDFKISSATCPKVLRGDNTYLMDGSATTQKFTRLPFSAVQAYIVKMSHYGHSGLPAVLRTGTGYPVCYGFNIADPNFINYIFNTYIPNILLPNGPNAKNGIPTDASHPTYIEIDAFNISYDFFGVLDPGFIPGGSPGVTWDAGYPQSAAAWYQGWVTFFKYAKMNRPEIRLSPHVSSLPDWSIFSTVFADVPSLMNEPFNISSLHGASSYQHNQWFNIFNHLYWFTNVALPVFVNEPRVLDWGNTVDNGDIHTALASYSLVRGPNSFFSALTPGEVAVNPLLYSDTLNKIGSPSGSSAVQVVKTAGGHLVGDGYNLLMRIYSGGVAYLNMTGSQQTVSLANGTTDWNGHAITSITLADGQGEVVLGQSSGTPGNGPNVSIYEPMNSSTIGNHFTMGAYVSDATSAITQVQFFDNGNLLGTAVLNKSNNEGEYLWTWQTAPTGNHSLTAIATDAGGNKTTSAAVKIVVN